MVSAPCMTSQLSTEPSLMEVVQHRTWVTYLFLMASLFRRESIPHSTTMTCVLPSLSMQKTKLFAPDLSIFTPIQISRSLPMDVAKANCVKVSPLKLSEIVRSPLSQLNHSTSTYTQTISLGPLPHCDHGGQTSTDTRRPSKIRASRSMLLRSPVTAHYV